MENMNVTLTMYINASHEEWQQYYRTIEILMIYFICVSFYDEWTHFTKKFLIFHTFMLKVIGSDKTKSYNKETVSLFFFTLEWNQEKCFVL